jgi:preprotein translocase subunit SecA
MRELERRVILSVLDRKWREHLYEMDYLQEGIGLRALAQKDPVVEYQREGFDLFTAMMDAIKEESASLIFAAEVQVEQAAADDGQAQAPAPQVEVHAPQIDEVQRPSLLQYSAPTLDSEPSTEGMNRAQRRAAKRKRG